MMMRLSGFLFMAISLMLAGNARAAGDGLRGTYYNQNGVVGAYFTGTTAQRIDPTINFNWGGAPGVGATPANHFSVRWTGEIELPSTGIYQFATDSNDGVNLYIDWNRDGDFADAFENPVSNFVAHSSNTINTSSFLVLNAGRYPIRLDYYDRTGPARIRLYWRTPGSGTFVIVPQASLYSGASVAAFRLTFGASSCLGQSLTISAVDASNAVVSGYTGTVQLSTSTSHGNWSLQTAAGTLSPNPDSDDNGAASYSFAAADSGSAILRLANPRAETLTVTVSDSSLGISSTSAPALFSNNFFVITTPDVLGEDVVAGRSHQLHVELWNISGSICGIVTAYTGSKNLKAWASRDAADPGGTAPLLNAVSLPNSQPAANNLTASFVSGALDLTLASSDVGKYGINLRDDSLSFSSLPITGSSNVLVARPFGLALDFSNDRLSNGTSGNSTATDASGPLFARAGQPFSTTISAVQWQAADDSNNDGRPDAGANLYDNALTLRFGLEPTPATVDLSPVLVQPAAGSLGSLNNGSNLGGFSAGTTTATPDYSEVGIIRLDAGLTGGSYLGSGRDVTGSAANLGRFAPDHFRLTASSLTPFCSTATPFSYMGQVYAVSYQLVAEDASNTLTSNYTGTFAKLDLTNAAALGFGAINLGATPTPLSARLLASGLTGSWSNGSSSAAGTQLTLNRAASPDGSFDLFSTGLNPVDSDSTVLASASLNLDTDNNGSNDAVSLGLQSLRYGRLAVDTVAGSELLALAVPVRLEYWKPVGSSANGSFFPNSDDSCSTLTTAPAGPPSWGNFTLGSYTNNLLAGETVPSSWSGFASGAGTLTLSAPGTGNDGALVLTVSGPVWLRYDYNKTVAGDENASARESFGLFRGRSPVIYWRENFR